MQTDRYLFRGKRTFNGKWAYGNFREIMGLCYIGGETEDNVQENTIGQYTGMLDCKGNKIFEGDILRLTIPDDTIRYFLVEWASENRMLMPLDGFKHDGNPVCISGWCFNWQGHRLYPSVIDGIHDNERMCIVGNVYDNPDLLK